MEKNEIKKAKIIHPFFIAIFPILIIYSQNIGKMDVEALALPLFLIVGSSVLIYFVIKLILKNANKSAIIVTIILMIMFSMFNHPLRQDKKKSAWYFSIFPFLTL